jgi:hypothetical protein
MGCAETIRQGAKEAAPAAVKGGAEAASRPSVRDDIATLLGDRKIHDAASNLSEAVVDGALDALSDEERVARMKEVSTALAAQLGPAIAQAIRKDIGPVISATVADAVHLSIERALDESTEQRLQAIAVAVSRGAAQGFSESLSEVDGQPNPRVRQATTQLVREMSREAAFGFEDAVRQAEQQRANGDRRSGNVLALAGRTADFTLSGVPLIARLVAGGIFLALVAGLVFALLALRRQARAHRSNTGRQLPA